MTYPLKDGEQEIFQITADSVTVLRTKEVTGRLVLTNQRVLFVHPLFGVQTTLLHSQIDSFERYRVAFLFPYGLLFHLKDGKKVRYAIRNREKWIDFLNRYVREKEIF